MARSVKSSLSMPNKSESSTLLKAIEPSSMKLPPVRCPSAEVVTRRRRRKVADDTTLVASNDFLNSFSARNV